MRETTLAACVLVGAMLASGVGRPHRAAAGEAAAPQAPAAQAAKPAPPEALKGFKGFLVGELVATNERGIVLFVQAVTLVEGNAAPNPGVLLGKDTPVQFVITKDEQGKARPDPELAQLVKRVKDMPAVAFGGLGGNAVVVMGGGQPGGAAIRNMHITTHRMTMRVNGAEIQVGPDDEAGDAQANREPKGPIVTARVRAGDDGKLVMDRVMPGSTPGHTWTAMPRLRIADAPGPDRAEIPHAPEHAEFARIKAQRRALQQAIAALAKHKAVLERQLARQGQHAQERIAALARQRDQMAEQIARLTDRLADLKQEAARLGRPAPPHAPPPPPPAPPRPPGDADF